MAQLPGPPPLIGSGETQAHLVPPSLRAALRGLAVRGVWASRGGTPAWRLRPACRWLSGLRGEPGWDTLLARSLVPGSAQSPHAGTASLWPVPVLTHAALLGQAPRVCVRVRACWRLHSLTRLCGPLQKTAAGSGLAGWLVCAFKAAGPSQPACRLRGQGCVQSEGSSAPALLWGRCEDPAPDLLCSVLEPGVPGAQVAVFRVGSGRRHGGVGIL